MRPHSSGVDSPAPALPEETLFEKQTVRLQAMARRLRMDVPHSRALQVQFLRSELDTGNTFAKVALSSSYSEKRKRNQVQAKKALESFSRFSKDMALTPAESKQMAGKLRELRSKLKKLEEKESARQPAQKLKKL